MAKYTCRVVVDALRLSFWLTVMLEAVSESIVSPHFYHPF